ncbi:MAG: hypothetical protein EOS27_20940 [Mesorhizobium sp.]|nr:MAG: hypothetical protein EOS27_20940 [Mesorhizobium sp.]
MRVRKGSQFSTYIADKHLAWLRKLARQNASSVSAEIGAILSVAMRADYTAQIQQLRREAVETGHPPDDPDAIHRLRREMADIPAGRADV